MTCVKPFGLQHLMLVNRLQSRGTLLDLEQSLTRPRGVLWAALLGHGSLAEGPVCTVVLRETNEGRTLEGFAQARLRPGNEEADVVCMAPALDCGDAGDETWRQLLSGLVAHLARQGVQRVFARLSDELEAARLFLDAGFILYTREDVFQLQGLPMPPDEVLLEPAGEDATWGIARLYAAVTPKVVRSAEGLGNTSAAGLPSAAGGETAYVWNKEGEIAAYVRLLSGPGGHWMRVLIHPDDTERAGALLRDALGRLPGHASNVFCSLRAYQGNLRRPLQDAGFRFVTSQSVLVRQNVVPVREAQPVHATALEKRAEVRTPTAARHDA